MRVDSWHLFDLSVSAFLSIAQVAQIPLQASQIGQVGATAASETVAGFRTQQMNNEGKIGKSKYSAQEVRRWCYFRPVAVDSEVKSVFGIC